MPQANWRWCNKCQGLFFAGNPNQEPALRKEDTTSAEAGITPYSLRVRGLEGRLIGGGATSVRVCSLRGNPTSGACPAEGGHNFGGSGNYRLQFAPTAGQINWRWCNKCQGLFFVGN